MIPHLPFVHLATRALAGAALVLCNLVPPPAAKAFEPVVVAECGPLTGWAHFIGLHQPDEWIPFNQPDEKVVLFIGPGGMDIALGKATEISPSTLEQRFSFTNEGAKPASLSGSAKGVLTFVAQSPEFAGIFTFHAPERMLYMNVHRTGGSAQGIEHQTAPCTFLSELPG